MSVFISPPKTGTTSIGEALRMCGFSVSSWCPDIFGPSELSQISLANRLISNYTAISSVPIGCRLHYKRELAFIKIFADQSDAWADWPLGHECIDPLLKKIVVPKAKFIFCVREPSDWVKSLAIQFLSVRWSDYKSYKKFQLTSYAIYLKRVLFLKMEFPNDVLIYNVLDGWEPLSTFLNIQTPNIPFPNLNVSKLHKKNI